MLRPRYTEPDTPRPYRIPGGKIGVWAVAGLGLIGSAFGLDHRVHPPAGIDDWRTPVYVAAMFAAIAICSLPPFVIEQVKKPSWKTADPDNVLPTSTMRRRVCWSPRQSVPDKDLSARVSR